MNDLSAKLLKLSLDKDNFRTKNLFITKTGDLNSFKNSEKNLNVNKFSTSTIVKLQIQEKTIPSKKNNYKVEPLRHINIPEINKNSILASYRKEILNDKIQTMKEFQKTKRLFKSKSEINLKCIDNKVHQSKISKQSVDQSEPDKVPQKTFTSKIFHGLNHNSSLPNLKILTDKDTELTIDKPKNLKDEKALRKRSFKVNYINRWFEKNGLLTPTIVTGNPSNIEIQSKLILDEINVLNENIVHYRSKYLNSPEMKIIFSNFSNKNQINYNKSMEEVIGLMIEIAKIILLDFYDYMGKFVALHPPNEALIRDTLVKNEFSAFYANLNLFCEISSFLKSCFDVYQLLIKQVDDMIISTSNFKILQQYLARARYKTSFLIITLKNTLRSMSSDIKLITNNPIEAYKKINLNEAENQNIVKNDQILKMNNDQYNIILMNERLNKNYDKIGEEVERTRRINVVLKSKEEEELNDSFQIKKREVSKKLRKKIDINSELINKLMKYCPKEIKNKIISQRIIERYKDNYDD